MDLAGFSPGDGDTDECAFCDGAWGQEGISGRINLEDLEVIAEVLGVEVGGLFGE